MFKILNYKRKQHKGRKDKGTEVDNKYEDEFFKNLKNIECMYLNKKGTHDNHYFKDQIGNICKYIDNKDVLDWEVKIYLKFVQYNIFPLTTCTNNHIIYYTNNLISLRTYLNTYDVNITFLIYELCSFINSFLFYGFIHGNLHIDNIYIYQNNLDSNKFEFYIIDYTNACSIDKSCECMHYKHIVNAPQYNRTSFLGDQRIDFYRDDFNKLHNWDFITLYISLKLYLKDYHDDFLHVLDNIISNYIDINNVNNLLKKCKSSVNNTT